MPSRDDPLRIQFDYDGVIKIHVCDPVSWETLDALDEAVALVGAMYNSPAAFI